MDLPSAVTAIPESAPPSLTPDEQKHSDLISQLTTALAEASELPTKGRGTLGEKVNEFYADRLKNIFKAPEIISPEPWSPCWANQPPDVVPTLKMLDYRIGSDGNITVLIAPPSSGKSSICEAIISCFQNPLCDSLGFSCHSGRGLSSIDTEMSKADCHASWRRMLKRAELDNMADNVKWFNIKDWDSFEQRRSWLFHHMETDKPGIIILDGIGDFIPNLNDIEASSQLVLDILSRAEKFNISVLATIHGNPRSRDGAEQKARGHLGSELMRKAECVMMIQRDDHDIRKITTDFKHGKNRSDNDRITNAFTWSDERKMMVTCELERWVDPTGKDMERLQKMAEKKMKGWKRDEIAEYMGDDFLKLKKEGQKSRIRRFIEDNCFVKVGEGVYDLPVSLQIGEVL